MKIEVFYKLNRNNIKINRVLEIQEENPHEEVTVKKITGDQLGESEGAC